MKNNGNWMSILNIIKFCAVMKQHRETRELKKEKNESHFHPIALLFVRESNKIVIIRHRNKRWFTRRKEFLCIKDALLLVKWTLIDKNTKELFVCRYFWNLCLNTLILFNQIGKFFEFNEGESWHFWENVTIS